MNRTEFCCVYQLADAMAQYVEDNLTEYNYPVVAVYANYEVAKELVEALIMSGNGIGGILELESYEMSNYDKPFVIYLTEDGVTCEKIYRDGVYYRGESDIAFVHEDCNSAILDYIYSDVALEFGFTGECEMDEEELDDLECDCNCDCDCNVGDCCSCDDCKEETKPTITTATYTVNGRPVNKEEFDECEKAFREKMREIEDEMNAIKQLFRW